MGDSKIKGAGCTDIQDFSFRIDSLNMNDPENVVWAYRNIQQVYSHSAVDFEKMVKIMMGTKLLDFNTSLIVLEMVGNALQDHFEKQKEDEEISFVASKCGLSISSGENKVSTGYIDYLYKLILPFARICTKQVVDIVAFLFTRTSRAEFDELFEMFEKKKDFLVELYLLKVRLMRERSLKYKCGRCKDAREMSSLEMEEWIKNMKISSVGELGDDKGVECEKKTDFYSIDSAGGGRREDGMEGLPEELSFSQDKPFFESTTSPSNNSKDREEAKNKLEGDTLECRPHQRPYEEECHDGVCRCRVEESEDKTCLCASYKPSDESRCLKEAKKYLLDIESVSPRFFLENVALYLSLSFDKELLDLFEKYIGTEYEPVCASHIFKLKAIDSGVLEAMIGRMRNSKREMLKSDNLPVTDTTFGLYIEWCADTFGSISISSVNDYSNISKLYIKFLRSFPHKKMFLILEEICESKIERVSDAVYAHIAEDLEEIVKILLNLFNSTEENNKLSKDEEKMSMLGDEKTFKNAKRLNSPEFCIEQELERIVLEVCKRYRKAFLSQIRVLDHFPDNEFLLKISKTLCTNYENDWRYRRALLHSYREWPKFFGEILNIDSFTKDPVFIVRRTALDIKEEIDVGSESKIPKKETL
ncbi:uncharacterized protein Eint_101620 [Encephalitozoon intestinalis ATCC 50506]|uniref:Uncharacterized protein n=1 Tax=Encephalitozoon intestinalis (strain ATCC 50506) TaxID=876142 RepID=E0S9V2_ENCIT|nr:uncharacterized protein Eint_101620 [Encephalitozoon intestinalis ATCC 50506]ADM12487.1 hypothetical protein Eint_101620 [Encephalitozoon intestinalis ATCC 50506]UTX46324.1 hypothetical protein GPK93_10g19240 [Encephalitozoon intestinalis]